MFLGSQFSRSSNLENRLKPNLRKTEKKKTNSAIKLLIDIRLVRFSDVTLHKNWHNITLLDTIETKNDHFVRFMIKFVIS